MKKYIKIIAVILALICLTGCSNLSIKDWSVKKQAINYLCDKYDAEPDEFELLDSRNKHLAIIEDSVWPRIGMVDYAFEFQYNDRQFFVNMIDNQFYDDYQLEDIENWCTECLQENIDSRIIGFDLCTADIKVIYNILGYEYEVTLCKEDAENIIKCYKNKDIIEKPLFVYFCGADLSKSDSLMMREQLKTKIQDTYMNGNDNCFVWDTNDVGNSTSKDYDYQWIRFIGN